MTGYRETLESVLELESKGAEVGLVGKSLLGRFIPYVKVGTGKTRLIITAAIHAREFVTSGVVISQARYAMQEGVNASVYFVPMVNPDGVEIALGRAKPPSWYLGEPSLWKANARGVDLNVNFPAKWGSGGSNVFSRSFQSYVGEKPLSEPESIALARFTEQILPHSTVSYHSKGRELYFDFYQNEQDLARDGEIAEKINQRLGYKIVTGLDSAGGYKDWCVSRLKIPAFTVEIGDDRLNHPLTSKDVEEDVLRNIDLPQKLTDAIHGRKIYENGA